VDALGPWHLALILLGFVLLFGYKKLPDAARSVGRSLRIFTSEMRALSEGLSEPASPSADELEARAAQAEAEAAALRSRAAAAQRTPDA
jgi:sec-independent protein translocase protein TatA